jgi:hypothetical protein
MKIIEKEFNAITGEETITEREETNAETKARLERAKAISRRTSRSGSKGSSSSGYL